LELGLRLAGFGYSTGFFLKKEINHRDVLIENGKFGFRFFPPELARSPAPLVLTAQKPERTYRIFLLGESAALGDPEPAFGFGRWLEAMLNERFPGTRFEVVCTAMTAINSHSILPIARDCARQAGDLWVIYMGNNEFVGPFGTGALFGPRLSNLSLIRLSLALKSLRVGQMLDSLRQHLSPASRRPTAWGGMKMFLESEIAPDDPQKERVYQNFQRNLEDILRVAERARVKVVLSTVAANLRDCAPFASRHRTRLTDSELSQWNQFYDQGFGAERASDFAKAAAYFAQAAKVDDSFADLPFQLGRCELALTNARGPKAARYFTGARDSDALPFRADSRLNQIIQAAASRHQDGGVSFVDSATALAAQSPSGILGHELLLEHVHLNFEGNYLLARTMADQIASLLPPAIAKEKHGEWVSFEDCARRLAVTDWDRRRVYDTILRRELEPPFINQLNHSQEVARWQATLAALRTNLTAQAARDARKAYEEALARDPGDFQVHGNYAKFLEDTGHISDALAEWNRVRDLIPFEAAPYYFAAKLLARTGKTNEALADFTQTLEIHPDYAEALDEKAQLLTKMGRPAEAMPLLGKAIRLQPGDARIRIHRADALALLKRRNEALRELEEAIRVQPGQWEARYLLGVELALDGKFREAAEQFNEVTRLNPNHATAQLNLGIALAKLGRIDEAKARFQETLRLDPRNQKAAQYLSSTEAVQKRTATAPK